MFIQNKYKFWFTTKLLFNKIITYSELASQHLSDRKMIIERKNVLSRVRDTFIVPGARAYYDALRQQFGPVFLHMPNIIIHHCRMAIIEIYSRLQLHALMPIY